MIEEGVKNHTNGVLADVEEDVLAGMQLTTIGDEKFDARAKLAAIQDAPLIISPLAHVDGAILNKLFGNGGRPVMRIVGDEHRMFSNRGSRPPSPNERKSPMLYRGCTACSDYRRKSTSS